MKLTLSYCNKPESLKSQNMFVTMSYILVTTVIKDYKSDHHNIKQNTLIS